SFGAVVANLMPKEGQVGVMRKPSHWVLEAIRSGVPGRLLSRRRWLTGAALAFPGLAWPAWGQAPSKRSTDASEQALIERVQDTARKAGLGPLRSRTSEHFLGLGNAPPRFQSEAVEKVCEPLARAFVTHFGERGFPVDLPKHRMTVVTLKDHASYRAYIGQDPGPDVGGQYDLETNQLVVFDFRTRPDVPAEKAERVNTLTLVHETTHMLSFNTGLLAREADVPACISEGLATYVELWKPSDRRGRGFDRTTNIHRLQVLIDAGADEVPWISLTKLVADDGLFDKPETAQLAYAESWLLVHRLMTPAWRSKFQAYLAGLPRAGEAKRDRVADAEARLGSLGNLDKELKRHARDLLRR
ncbi:MAG TPA: DUF1570 domain-containing protein, partial [Isosphaeraceae bacterium]|nr:DUF1570 domain-containing protein [Isosphaeraceae bacterium]